MRWKKTGLNMIYVLWACLLSFSRIAEGACLKEAPIVKTTSPRGWLIHTQSSAYHLIVTEDGRLRQVYYGPKVQDNADEHRTGWNEGHIDEVPVRDGHPFKTPVLEVIFSDGVRDADLKYVKGEIVTIDDHPALKITQEDRYYPLEVISYIRVLPEYNILEKWITIKNTGGSGNIKVENILSGSIVLPEDEYILTQLSGKQMNEFQLYNGRLMPGLRTLQNKTFKSNFNPPWFAVRPRNANRENGPVWFGSLHYSGNWILDYDKRFEGGLQILGGINFWDTDWTLSPGESFTTPKLSLGFSERGLEGASQDLAGYIRDDILPRTHRHELRPVIFNGYYGSGLDINEKQQETLAEVAAKMGVELFVIDDGWFKGRINHDTGLGDWVVDSLKFPHGLMPLIGKVHNLGMKFGIWLEPENVDVNSDLFRAHPDWVLHVRHRKGNLHRRILNLAKPEVYNALLESISNVLSKNDIDYVKWDQNNYLGDAGWPDAPPGEGREVRIRYIRNLYRLIDELEHRFPKVWFESCASGGGRIDLGMMSRMDLAWVSDNTYALNRIFIQYGYLSCMPANTMASFVVDKIGNKYRQPTSLNFRFDVAMSGVLGISTDIGKWTPAQRDQAKAKIKQYKQIRPLVQQGTLYRLISPFTSNKCALQFNSPDSISSVLFCYNMAQYLPGSQIITRGSKVLKLKGLKPGVRYRLRNLEDPEDKGDIYTGNFLTKVGIAWPVKEANSSRVFILEKMSK